MTYDERLGLRYERDRKSSRIRIEHRESSHHRDSRSRHDSRDRRENRHDNFERDSHENPYEPPGGFYEQYDYSDETENFDRYEREHYGNREYDQSSPVQLLALGPALIRRDPPGVMTCETSDWSDRAVEARDGHETMRIANAISTDRITVAQFWH